MAGRPRTRSHEEWLEYQRQKRAQARKDKTELQLKNERILILEAELAKLKSKLEGMENE